MTKKEALDAIEYHNPRNRTDAEDNLIITGSPIEDMRTELVEHYEGNPPDGYVPAMDDTDMIAEDMIEYVNELSDKEVQRAYLKFKVEQNEDGTG